MKNLWFPLLLILGLGGCTWSGLDDLSKQTPVRVYEKNKGFTSPTYGASLIVLRRPAGDPRLPTIIVGGQYTTPLAALEIGSGGGVANTRIAHVGTNEIEPNQDRQGNTIQSIVELSPVGDDARVLIAVPQDDYVRWVRIPPADAAAPDLISGGIFRPDPNIFGGVRGFGGALAAGSFDAETGPQEWAIAEDNYIYIAMNETYDPSDFVRCQITGPGTSDFTSVTRALATGRFAATETSDTFVAGIPDSRPPYGSVRFVRWSGVPECNASLLPPTDPSRHEEYFGTALAVARLRGPSADMDLIVGSPNKNDVPQTSSRVYVYVNNGTPMESTTPSYIIEGTTLTFGTTVAAMDLNGDGKAELLVGDPAADFEGNTGRAFIFEIDWTYNGTPTTLSEEDGVLIGDTAGPTKMFGADLKEKSHGFSLSFAGLAWEPGAERRELIVGSAGLIFGFYVTGVREDNDRADPFHDPRD